jgi:hypothetical protein
MITSNDETAALQWFRLNELPPLSFPYPDRALEAEGAAYFEWDDTWTREILRA